jgi:hypothetical protein
MERNRKFQLRNDSYHNDTNDKEENDEEESARDTQFKNPCRKHNKKHEWKDCPDNPNNKSRTTENEVSSMDSTKKKTSFVRFKPKVEEIESSDEKTESESKTSLGE